MEYPQVIRTVSRLSGVSLNSIGRAMGRPDSYVSSGIARGSVPKADTLAAMLHVCGYCLCAVPIDDVPASAVIIDPTE